MGIIISKNMLKIFWQKIKQNHLLMMALCCLIPIILIIGLLSLFEGSSKYWTWLIILLCPLMHIFMMRGHKNDDSCGRKTSKGAELYNCLECGLKYREKKWAEKCEEWCKEHKSCNLEITKHALKNERLKNN